MVAAKPAVGGGVTMNQTARSAIVRQFLMQVAIWLVVMAALLFASAGSLHWPEAWIYLALWLAIALVSGLLLARDNPEILQERLRPPFNAEQKAWDKPLLAAIVVGWVALHIVSGVDAVRFGWSRVPAWLQIAGASAIVAGAYIIHRVMRSNRYAATSVKIQSDRGHRVIDTGPYAVVRHPMYAGAIPYFLGTALLLGSWWGFGVALALIAIVGYRAKREEETLSAELSGYADYLRRVRYRLVPGLW